MTDISVIIGWKFDNQPGMKTVNGQIVEFPGGIPNQASIDAWTAEYELSAEKSAKRASVDALYASTVSTFSWGGYTWQATQDIKDSAQWAQDAIDGGALTGNLRWHGGSADYVGITLDNQLVTMDAQSVVARAKAMAPKVYNARVNARKHKDAINALGSVAAVEAYDISTGWPA